MLDKFNRTINYLRISVTDRCNLRCVYCMPPSGIQLFRQEDLLSFEDIVEVTKSAVQMGIDKVRLTGGEPLVRRDIITLVKMLSRIPGIKDFAMTTNGILLDRFAGPLAAVGLHRVNISLDTLNPDRYREITRGGDIHDVLRGIEAALKAGLSPVKLNCVMNNSSHEEDCRQVAVFAESNDIDIRFIRRMNRQEGLFWPVEGGAGGRCDQCNRLRLSSDGKLIPCLFSNLSFDIKKLGIDEALRQAVSGKPRSGSRGSFSNINAIGG